MFKQRLSSLLLSRTGFYFDDGQLFPFEKHLTQQTRNWFVRRQLKPVVVVSRRYYREQLKSYPITDRADLQKFLKAELGEGYVWQLGSVENNQRRVHIISWEPEVLSLDGTAWLLVPETWLYGAGLAPKNCHQIDFPGKPLVIFRERDQLVRAFSPTGLLASEPAIRSALGLSPSVPLLHVNSQHYYQQLSGDLLELPLWRLVNRSRTPSAVSTDYKSIGLLAIAVLFVYAVLSSTYLQLMTQLRQHQLDSISVQVSDKLALQQQIETEQQKLSALVAAKGDWQQLLNQWDLIAWLDGRNVRLANVTFEPESIKITGEVDSTTTLVQAMSELPYIANIEFTAPMRKGQQGEFFSLQLTFKASNLHPIRSVIEPRVSADEQPSAINAVQSSLNKEPAVTVELGPHSTQLGGQ
jgi:hypothetical protein